MSFGMRFKDWKQGRDLPPDSPVIPDYAEGFDWMEMVDVWGSHKRVSAHGMTWIWRTFEGKLFYPELLEQYYGAIELSGNKIHPGMLRRLEVLLITLDTDTRMQLTAKHQWLGYIQGVLSNTGVITLDGPLDDIVF